MIRHNCGLQLKKRSDPNSFDRLVRWLALWFLVVDSHNYWYKLTHSSVDKKLLGRAIQVVYVKFCWTNGNNSNHWLQSQPTCPRTRSSSVWWHLTILGAVWGSPDVSNQKLHHCSFDTVEHILEASVKKLNVVVCHVVTPSPLADLYFGHDYQGQPVCESGYTRDDQQSTSLKVWHQHFKYLLYLEHLART